jgi:hypothetical protein
MKSILLSPIFKFSSQYSLYNAHLDDHNPLRTFTAIRLKYIKLWSKKCSIRLNWFRHWLIVSLAKEITFIQDLVLECWRLFTLSWFGHRERHRYTITLSSDMRACEGSSLEIETKLFCRWIDLIIAFMCSFAFLRLPSSNLYNGSFYKLQMCFCIVIPLSKISNQAQLRCVGIPYSSSSPYSYSPSTYSYSPP